MRLDVDTNNRNDRIRFATIMKALEINFSANMGDTVEQREVVIRLYMQALADFSAEEIEAAAKTILLTRKYKQLPTIAEFIEAIRGPELSIEARALVASNVVIEALRTHDSRTNTTPDFTGDPITQYLMSQIWPFHEWKLSVKTDDHKWWRKEFVAVYKACVLKREKKLMTGPARYKKLSNPIFESLYPKKRQLPDPDQNRD